MLTIKSYIDESLFTGHDSDSLAKKVGDAIEKEAIEKFEKCCYSKKNSSNDYQIHLGPKGYEITTNSGARGVYMVDPSYIMLCNNIDEKSLDHKIAKFEGTLILNSSEAKDLTWLFTPDCEFHGRLVIEWNDYLTSLKGCPKRVQCFECKNNDKLNTLQGAPQWCDEFTWECNGNDKITREDITKYLKSRHVEINIG